MKKNRIFGVVSKDDVKHDHVNKDHANKKVINNEKTRTNKDNRISSS